VGVLTIVRGFNNPLLDPRRVAPDTVLKANACCRRHRTLLILYYAFEV
jgi:hypothetical protein